LSNAVYPQLAMYTYPLKIGRIWQDLTKSRRNLRSKAIAMRFWTIIGIFWYKDWL